MHFSVFSLVRLSVLPLRQTAELHRDATATRPLFRLLVGALRTAIVPRRVRRPSGALRREPEQRLRTVLQVSTVSVRPLNATMSEAISQIIRHN